MHVDLGTKRMLPDTAIDCLPLPTPYAPCTDFQADLVIGFSNLENAVVASEAEDEHAGKLTKRPSTATHPPGSSGASCKSQQQA